MTAYFLISIKNHGSYKYSTIYFFFFWDYKIFVADYYKWWVFSRWSSDKKKTDDIFKNLTECSKKISITQEEIFFSLFKMMSFYHDGLQNKTITDDTFKKYSD